MKTRLLIIVGLIILSAIIMTVFFTFSGIFYIFDNDSLDTILDIQMNVTGIKHSYEIGEPLTFSVQVNSLGKVVPWPTFRIYQN